MLRLQFLRLPQLLLFFLLSHLFLFLLFHFLRPSISHSPYHPSCFYSVFFAHFSSPFSLLLQSGTRCSGRYEQYELRGRAIWNSDVRMLWQKIINNVLSMFFFQEVTQCKLVGNVTEKNTFSIFRAEVSPEDGLTRVFTVPLHQSRATPRVSGWIWLSHHGRELRYYVSSKILQVDEQINLA